MTNVFRLPTIEREAVDKVCIESDGCPTELAVLQRYWRATQSTIQNTSDVIDEVDACNEFLDSEMIPRLDGDMALSLLGRVKRYAAAVAAGASSNAAVQPRAEGTSRCNSLLGGNAKEKT